MIEFLFDMTRAVVDLVLAGTIAGHADIEFIIPHAAATLPMIVDRVGVFSRLLDAGASADVLRDIARLHYDLAGLPRARQLDALPTITTLEHLHDGSDHPFTREFAVVMRQNASKRLARSQRPSTTSFGE